MVVAGRMVGLVRLDANRPPEPAGEGVHLLEHVACEPRVPGLRHHAPVGLANRLIELADVEQRDFRRLREQRQPQLFRVAIEGPQAAGVDPPPRVAPGLDVLEVAEDRVAVVRLQVLVAVDAVPRLRPGVERVEVLRLRVEVEAERLEVLVPVRVLDGDLDLGVRGPRGRHHQAAAGLVHQRQPERGPALRAFRADAQVALAAREEEVVEDDLVEVARRERHDLLQPLPVLGVRIAVRFELVRFVDGDRDAARHLHALAVEEAPGLVERGLVRDDRVAVRLEVDLADLHVGRDGGPDVLEVRGVLHLAHLVDAAIHGDAEVPVAAGARGGGRRDGASQQQGAHARGCRRGHGQALTSAAAGGRRVHGRLTSPAAAAIVPSLGFVVAPHNTRTTRNPARRYPSRPHPGGAIVGED